MSNGIFQTWQMCCIVSCLTFQFNFNGKVTWLSNCVFLTRQKVLHWDEVTKDEPEHHVFAVQTDQSLEQGKRHDAKLKNEF